MFSIVMLRVKELEAQLHFFARLMKYYFQLLTKNTDFELVKIFHKKD